MRDVSHQSVGAHILGLAAHNKNMFGRFVSNISEDRDWCSYWEINRYDKPAPVDYASDDAFWYNLNANFDVMQACLKMYAWTGDRDYIAGDAFAEFYNRTAADYVARWMLEPENVMRRPRHMNSPAEFDPANMFHTCRGLPSYVENFGGLTMSADLLAAMYAGFAARADMAALRGDAAAHRLLPFGGQDGEAHPLFEEGHLVHQIHPRREQGGNPVVQGVYLAAQLVQFHRMRLTGCPSSGGPGTGCL